MKMKPDKDNIEPYMEAIAAVYSPAQTTEEVTHWFTTDDIYNAIKTINPGIELPKEKIHDSMIDAGYRYQPRPGTFGLEFRWMLKAN